MCLQGIFKVENGKLVDIRYSLYSCTNEDDVTLQLAESPDFQVIPNVE